MRWQCHELFHRMPPGATAGGIAVVIDVLRASTTIVTALAHGAAGVLPRRSIHEARATAAARSTTAARAGAMLGGERGGVKIAGFDLGNSPAEYTADRVAGKPVVITTTNGTLAIAACHDAAEVLVGEHDFTSFETTPSTRLSKVRTIHALEVSRPQVDADAPGAELWIEVEGNGFLYNMVRIIAGSLVMVGSGRRTRDWLAGVLAARSRPTAGPTAPPEGLVLLATTLNADSPWQNSPINSAP